jgi:hypothetical protein
LIELALVLPMVLLLIFGVIDFGRAFNYQGDETQLANEAVRYATVGNCGPGCSSITAAVKGDAEPGLRNGSGSIAAPGVTITLCFPRAGEVGAVGEPIQARASATYSWLAFVMGGVTSSALNSSATARLEKAYDPSGASPLGRVGPC